MSVCEGGVIGPHLVRALKLVRMHSIVLKDTTPGNERKGREDAEASVVCYSVSPNSEGAANRNTEF